MIQGELMMKLMQCFDRSFINQHMEFIAHKEANEYFNLKACTNELDVKCKVLEWFSRGACKTDPFGPKKNKIFHEFMLNGINEFLGTTFNETEMYDIYTWIGNEVNRKLTIEFIESGYDMSLLREGGGKDE